MLSETTSEPNMEWTLDFRGGHYLSVVDTVDTGPREVFTPYKLVAEEFGELRAFTDLTEAEQVAWKSLLLRLHNVFERVAVVGARATREAFRLAEGSIFESRESRESYVTDLENLLIKLSIP